MPCKKDDFPKARSRMLMKPFKNKIQIMGFEEIYLCQIYFNIVDINNIKAVNKLTR